MVLESRHHGIIGLCLLMGYGLQVYFKSNEDRITNVRRNKTILIVFITICCFSGITMAVFGFTNLGGKRLKYDFTPISKQARQNYLLLSVVGVLFIIASIPGYVGVCGKKDIFAKAELQRLSSDLQAWEYMMISLSFGLGLLQMYFAWLILDVILTPDYEITEDQVIVKRKIMPNEVTSARYYMTSMLISALLQIFCGILTFLILYKYRKNRGYISVDENEADFTELLQLLRERESNFDEDVIQ